MAPHMAHKLHTIGGMNANADRKGPTMNTLTADLSGVTELGRLMEVMEALLVTLRPDPAAQRAARVEAAVAALENAQAQAVKLTADARDMNAAREDVLDELTAPDTDPADLPSLRREANELARKTANLNGQAKLMSLECNRLAADLRRLVG